MKRRSTDPGAGAALASSPLLLPRMVTQGLPRQSNGAGVSGRGASEQESTTATAQKVAFAVCFLRRRLGWVA